MTQSKPGHSRHTPPTYARTHARTQGCVQSNDPSFYRIQGLVGEGPNLQIEEGGGHLRRGLAAAGRGGEGGVTTRCSSRRPSGPRAPASPAPLGEGAGVRRCLSGRPPSLPRGEGGEGPASGRQKGSRLSVNPPSSPHPLFHKSHIKLNSTGAEGWQTRTWDPLGREEPEQDPSLRKGWGALGRNKIPSQVNARRGREGDGGAHVCGGGSPKRLPIREWGARLVGGCVAQGMGM